MKDLPNKPNLRINEVSSFFRVTPRTIRLWIEKGLIDAYRANHGILIKREDVLRHLVKIEKK
jgi:excisionase family DNA binding protein